MEQCVFGINSNCINALNSITIEFNWFEEKKNETQSSSLATHSIDWPTDSPRTNRWELITKHLEMFIHARKIPARLSSCGFLSMPAIARALKRKVVLGSKKGGGEKENGKL